MNDMILILSLSEEFALEAALRLRTEQVYTRIIDGSTTVEEIRKLDPRGILICGEQKNAPGKIDEGIVQLGIPVLALGHAAYLLLAAMGGACAGAANSPRKVNIEYGESRLFAGLKSGERCLEETLTLMLPADVQGCANAGGCTIAFEDVRRKLYGVQFEPERNDPEGTTILKNFARDICRCEPWYTREAVIAEAEGKLAEAAELADQAVCVVSGGVDSTVAAVLTKRAFGERMIAIYMETGLMREGESSRIQAAFEELDIPLRVVDRSGVVLDALANRRNMKEKHEVVARCLQQEMAQQVEAMPGKKVIVLGSNYSDFLSGKSSDGWKICGVPVLEPLGSCFKEEVRGLAEQVGLSPEIAGKKPFPLLGLGARILGQVNADRLHALRTADAIFSEEIDLAGLSRKLYKYFPVLLDFGLPHGRYSIILRAVTLYGTQLVPARLPYDLVERTVQRIQTATPDVLRVFYDQTPTELGKETFV